MNKKEFDFLGITKWHNSGYKGKGVIVASRESDDAEHGYKVYDVLKQICPSADIKISSEYEKDEDYDIYTTSLFFSSDKFDKAKKRTEYLYKKNKFLVCAVGNKGSDTQTQLSKHLHVQSIGACILSEDLKKASYSSITDDLDFMSITNMETALGKFTGTSCAAPVFAGMCALVQNFFIIHTGKKLTNEQLLHFIHDNCKDLETEGRDARTGHGIFILPDPSAINIYKYGGIKMFEGPYQYEEAIDFLAQRGEMDSPDMWKCRIKETMDLNLMWFCIKWANAVAKN